MEEGSSNQWNETRVEVGAGEWRWRGQVGWRDPSDPPWSSRLPLGGARAYRRIKKRWRKPEQSSSFLTFAGQNLKSIGKRQGAAHLI
jgi:hypothetical protein